MSFPNGVTVTRLRGTTEDDGYGGDRTDWTTPDRLDIPGCALAPRLEEEAHERGRQGVRHAWTLYTPYGVDITAYDRIEHPTEGVFEADGPLLPWRNPFTGRQAGAAIHLKRVDG